MITKINGVKIVLALCSTYAPQTIADISIQKYEFIGMRNVWHERDMYHEVTSKILISLDFSISLLKYVLSRVRKLDNIV